MDETQRKAAEKRAGRFLARVWWWIKFTVIAIPSGFLLLIAVMAVVAERNAAKSSSIIATPYVSKRSAFKHVAATPAPTMTPTPVPAVVTQAEKPEELTPEEIRKSLEVSYRLTMSEQNLSLNFIKSKYTKGEKGYSLWAVHTFFSRYSFDIGPNARTVQAWINENRVDLDKAKVVRVGVMNPDGDNDRTWFDIK